MEHAQCVPPSEYSEPGFITESYQTLHPISSEELLTLKTESEYPTVILRDTPLNPLQGDYYSVKQEVVSPDNMCAGRLSRGEGLKTILRTELCWSRQDCCLGTFAFTSVSPDQCACIKRQKAGFQVGYCGLPLPLALDTGLEKKTLLFLSAIHQPKPQRLLLLPNLYAKQR